MGTCMRSNKKIVMETPEQCFAEGCSDLIKQTELHEHMVKKHPKYGICGRCYDGHGDIEYVLSDELFTDEYYELVCDECHGYLLENQ